VTDKLLVSQFVLLLTTYYSARDTHLPHSVPYTNTLVPNHQPLKHKFEMAHRRMNSRPVNPAYQYSVHSPPLSPSLHAAKPLSAAPASPMAPWSESRPPSPESSPTTSSKNSLDSLPLPLSSISSFESTKEFDYYRDEDEDVFIGTPARKASSQAWPKRFFSSLLTRRPRPRSTFILLLILTALSLYIIFTSSSLAPRYTHLPASETSVQDAHIVEVPKVAPNLHISTKVNKKMFKGIRPPLVLSATEELAALTSFLIALPQNVLPSDVDASKPIDPQLILDFDIRGGRKARTELQVVRTQVWEENPVVVYAKRYAPNTKLLLGSLLNPLNVHPPPAVFFVDERQDGDILAAALQRVSSSLTPVPLTPSTLSSSGDKSILPMILIGGQPLDIPYDEMLQKNENDNAAHKIMLKTALKEVILKAGAETNEGKKKKGGH